MKPKNLLFIMSDQHSRKVAGCYGNRLVKTPVLDRLAASGTVFENAYTSSPICVPARAGLATGRQVHETRCWDNASPYTGQAPSWGHRLRAHGVRVESIGKLHYRNEQDDTGFDRQIIPLHIVKGIGDVMGSVKDPMPLRRKARNLVNKIGPGESTYTNYDQQIREHACEWLLSQRVASRNTPWMLFVSFVAPHPPWFAPQAYYDRYEGVTLPSPKPLTAGEDHPWLEARRASHSVDPFFTDETRRTAIRSYYALTSYLDDNVGKVLDALERSGLANDTRVVYTSDHGEDLGSRAQWGKGTMTEEASGIPLILSGPDVPRGRRITAPVSLMDVFPSVLDCCGVAPEAEDLDLPGRSLFELAAREDDPERPLMTQYHASGAASGAFMLRRGHLKYMHYVGFPPQLYDLARDPEELRDVSKEPQYAGARNRLERELRGLVDPEAVDAQAKADQRAIVERNGGREAVVSRGSFGYTPAPGETPEYI
ncbi:MAG TPA: sulfatase-like hydrolase/transferase [Burkholderiales bacterium]|nr:sulfatase-like hydrolase/transferase [Burkholderiales bacterium]